MSTLNKFIIFQCDVCRRQTELMIDGKRVDPLRCNITLKCRGKLSRVGESSVKKFLFAPPVPGLQDYVPRGSVLSSAPADIIDPNIALNTGDGILSTASLRKSGPSYQLLDVNNNLITVSPEVKLKLNIFPISPSLLRSSSYTYLRSGAVQVISGPDDTPSSNVLRFEALNNLSVLVNGIVLDPSQYDRSVLNQITFTPAIYESNNVIDIIVYNDIAYNVKDDSLISLSFSILTDTGLLSSCSWGNYNAVEIPGDAVTQRYIMHCVDLSALSHDISYGVKGVQLIDNATISSSSMIAGNFYIIVTSGDVYPISDFTSVGAADNLSGTIFQATGSTAGTGTVSQVIDISLSEVNLLTAKDPYSFQDKELNAYLSGASFNSSFSFTFNQDQLTGIYKLTALQSSFSQLLRILVPSVPSSLNLLTSTSGASTAATGLKHKYIIGPT
jgi:hypothetical protein